MPLRVTKLARSRQIDLENVQFWSGLLTVSKVSFIQRYFDQTLRIVYFDLWPDRRRPRWAAPAPSSRRASAIRSVGSPIMLQSSTYPVAVGRAGHSGCAAARARARHRQLAGACVWCRRCARAERSGCIARTRQSALYIHSCAQAGSTSNRSPRRMTLQEQLRGSSAVTHEASTLACLA